MCSTTYNFQDVTTRLYNRKRARSESESSEDGTVKRSRSEYGILLGYNIPRVFSEGEVSLANRETDTYIDTPFDDTSSECNGSDVVEIEYECVSNSENDAFLSDISTGDEATLAVGAIAAVLCDSSLEPWFSDWEEDSDEDSDNSSVEGDELERRAWRLCIQCKGKNNNPLYRYCQECFQKRKEQFPPRPKGFKKRDELEEKVKKKSKSKGCSQDSGIGSFESDILDTQIEEIRPKRKRSSISDEYNSDIENTKRFKLDGSSNKTVLDLEASDCHEVPILKVHTARESTESDTGSTVGELDTTKKNKSSWIKKSVFIKDDENEDKQLEAPLKEDDEFSRRSFAVTKELCMMCASVTKNSIFLHGTTGHLACCYQCSMKTWKTTKCCPVCKAKVRNVVKVYS